MIAKIIDAALEYKRTVIMLSALIIFSGIVSYMLIPKEEGPDVSIPNLYIGTSLEGISSLDADKLLATPITRELKGIDGLNKITSTSTEGYAAISLEFDSDVDIDEALVDVREQVDKARSDLPEGASEPSIIEINIALFPILVITLSGDIDEAELFHVADLMQDRLESLPGVLEANIKGDREEFAEVVVNPYLIESYNLDINEIIRLIANNNRLVTAGALDTGEGRFGVKVPGLLEDEGDIMNLPIKVVDDVVITYNDVTVARRTYKDPSSYSRFNGKSTVSLEIVKRIGENSINTIEAVKRVIEESQPDFPTGLRVDYSSDASVGIKESLDSLFNNVLSAAILVMLFAIVFVGIRSATLVGLAIPCAFLAAILIINIMGYTLNIVVLFALILSVGMLVDGAIVVAEFADMKMSQGMARKEAYAMAAKRMSWPIITSTATTLAAFFPLLFWPDVIGDFMRYIPITVITTLTSALVIALIVLPVVGSIIGKANLYGSGIRERLAASERGEYHKIEGLTGAYVRMVDRYMRQPYKVLVIMCLLFVLIITSYQRFGNGVQFFPSIEPDIATVRVRARGDLSLQERDQIVRQVEERILAIPHFKAIYTTVQISDGGRGGGGAANQDLIGNIQVEFSDWRHRPRAWEIMRDVEAMGLDFPGIVVEAKTEQAGPPSNADIEIQIDSDYKRVLDETIERMEEYLSDNVEGIKGVRTTRSLPSIAWEIDVDREKASQFNVDVSIIGSFIQMVTNGVWVSDYLPEGAQDELDIRVRFPLDYRNIDKLDSMRISAAGTQVPISNFIERSARPRENEVARVNGRYAYNIEIDLERGLRPDQKIPELTAILNEGLPEVVSWQFRGTQEDQDEASAFLMRAFGVAFFIMLTILVTQFNSFRQALLILSAIFFSTAGVFLGLLLRGEPFGVVMSGVGIIALAGIVVNNNIILIDTFNRLRREGKEARDAVLQTCTQRFRPIILTSVTTIMGLMPMVTQLNINWVTRELTVGAPSTQWWVQLSTAVAGGLFFATIITLFLTPSMLYLIASREERKQQKKKELALANAQPSL